MNRVEKRKFKKQLKSIGFSEEEIVKALLIRNTIHKKKYLKEGDKVKLNVDQMKLDLSWEGKNPEFKEWVETHADEIFTVEYDEAYKKNPMLVSLKECDCRVKWLFYEGDLEVVEGGDTNDD